jgi:hypothetical protein
MRIRGRETSTGAAVGQGGFGLNSRELLELDAGGAGLN